MKPAGNQDRLPALFQYEENDTQTIEPDDDFRHLDFYYRSRDCGRLPGRVYARRGMIQQIYLADEAALPLPPSIATETFATAKRIARIRKRLVSR